MPKKEKKETAVAVPENQLPMSTGTGGRGFDDMDQDDLIIPFAKLMQPLSPEVQDDEHPAKVGDLVNSLTGHVYGKELKFVPIIFQKRRINFRDIDEGGGIVCGSNNSKLPDMGDILSQRCMGCEHSQWVGDDPPACNLMYTFPSIVLGKVESENKLVAISFGKTSFKAGKRLVNIARMAGGDIFSRPYSLTTHKVKKDKFIWFQFEAEMAGKLSPADFKEAEGYFEMLSSMKYSIQDEPEVQPATNDDDPPF